MTNKNKIKKNKKNKKLSIKRKIKFNKTTNKRISKKTKNKIKFNRIYQSKINKMKIKILLKVNIQKKCKREKVVLKVINGIITNFLVK